MNVDLRHLRAIEAIAREGTLTAAAARLHVTQSALSHLVADLEARLGTRLFVRGRGMKLTPAGDSLLRSARIVREEMERLEHDLTKQRAGIMTTLRLATECYTCFHWLPEILVGFRREFPRVDIVIVPEAKESPIEYLRNGVLDLAIVFRPRPEDAPDVTFTPLFEDELVAVLPPGHPLTARRVLRPSDFRGEMLILHTTRRESTVMREFLRPAGVEPEGVWNLQLTEAVLECVRSGLGITVMPRWTLPSFPKTGDLPTRRLGRRGVHRVWHAAALASRDGDAALPVLVRLLQRAFSKKRRGVTASAGRAAGKRRTRRRTPAP